MSSKTPQKRLPRLVIEVTEEQREALKVAAARQRTSMREIVLKSLAANGFLELEGVATEG